MRRRATLLIAFAVSLAVTAGCTVGPSDRPPVAIRGLDAPGPPPRPPSPPQAPAVPDPGTFDAQSLPWQDCTESFDDLVGALPPSVQCAELRVASEVNRPTLAGAAELDLTRIGSGPAALVVLGDSAGPRGTVRAVQLAAQLPPKLLRSYTLIGMARRGTSPSDPLTCIPRPARQRLLGADPAATGPDDLNRLLDVARTAIQTCVQRVGQRLVSIDSSATADDLEQLRVALRAPVLNVVTLGETSSAVLGFANRYPASTGRIVLDGAPDPTLDAVGAARAHARAAEQAFARFAADCVDRGCPLAGDPRGAFTGLVRQLRAQPLDTPSVRVTAGIAYRAVLQGLADPDQWPRLARALDSAAAGDGTGLAELVAPLLDETGGRPPRFDAALAHRCNDTTSRLPPQRVRQLAEQWNGAFPLFGSLFAQRLLLCSSWPVPTDAPEQAPRRAPPLLVIATQGDALTPASGTQRAARQLPAAVLVRWQGAGHGALGRSDCVDGAAGRFLVDGRLPTPSTLCPP